MGLTVKWNAEISYVLTIYKYVLSILGLWVLDDKIFSRIRWFMSTIIEVSIVVSNSCNFQLLLKIKAGIHNRFLF